ncbi:MAG TPA: RES family NAD+ phosphorylase [Saprospiraceae bacterium]|nr:RES family NAD+ phosphorylase [Saprospiraceae bacterium]
MEVFRCSKCRYIRDLTGEGAYLYGGRWNSKGVRLLYTSSSAALALLETLVHTSRLLPAMDYCMLRLRIETDSMDTLPPSAMPDGWSDNPAPDELKRIGDRFVKEGKYLMLRVPSAVLPMEWNYLINPGHDLFSKGKVDEVVEIRVDGRLIS